MFEFFKQAFTWWSGQTLGLRLFTWRKGEFVGRDEVGNRYYRAVSAVPGSIPERRWVVYAGYAEASTIPPGWYGWMHHTVDAPPEFYAPRDWEKPHRPNLTGTSGAYHPPGSLYGAGRPTAAVPEYEAWRPD